MQQPRTKRQQIINASGTNGRKQQLEIEAYPIEKLLDSSTKRLRGAGAPIKD
jgi:hypothetical protein